MIEAMKQAIEHMEWSTPQGKEAYLGLLKAIADLEKQEHGDYLHQENDGCPIELSVLQRFWRGQDIPIEYQPSWFKQEPVAWKLVPIKPTEEMLKEMDECSKEGYDERLYAGHAASVYMAAVAVAPSPPKAEKQEHEWCCGECVKCGASIERQKPVAWRGYNWSHSPDDWVYRDFDDPILDGNGNNVGQPLYTSPKVEQEAVAWRNAAIRVGEDLCSIGPFGYYDMTAEQWLDWALSVVTVHAPPPQRQPLSDGQIEKCYETTGHYQTLRPQDRFAVFALARAIEAAHGIGEKK